MRPPDRDSAVALEPEPAATVTYADIEAAAQRLVGHAHRTPVLTSRTIDLRTGAKVYFKCENFQRMGAFKFRGAFNALSRLDSAARARGVLTYSSGNHAQAVALSAQMLGIAATIIMPDDAPAVKLEATRGYGAVVLTYDKTRTTREALARQMATERGMTLVPPYDHVDVIAGQGTAAKELIEDAGTLDYLFVCTGGAGLTSGCAIAAAHLSPGCRTIGVEPAAGDDATRSFKTGTLHTVDNPETIADGARTPSLGTLTFPLIQRYVYDMVTVDDDQLLDAMIYLWERMKIVVEPTGALGAAALFERKVHLPRGARVGVLISGGNVDVRAICALIARREARGRFAPA
ncbi:MAG: threo-3-hydroxy-L-aspartate ammonia-lyase [Proteobacteria bacterium]|nr:threo-3-hydroxy-L-aspartate ammonia-lyase [Burkholderiales bacterium]